MPYPHCTKQELASVQGTRLAQRSFSYMFSLKSVNLVTKIFVIKRAWTCHLLCKRPGCYCCISDTNIIDRIFKLIPIHALVIYQIPWICWFHWIQSKSINVLFHLEKNSWFLPLSRTSVIISTWYCTFHLVPLSSGRSAWCGILYHGAYWCK